MDVSDIPEEPPPPYSQVAPAQQQTTGHSTIERWYDVARGMPALQYKFQANLEKERILEHFRPGANPVKSLPMNPDDGLNANVVHNIKARWMEWGIWDDNWEITDKFGHWMHEDLDVPRKSINVARFDSSQYDGATFDPRIRFISKPTEKATLDKSRPINQFFGQVAHEHEFLTEIRERDQSNVENSIVSLEDQARANVRRRWTCQNMWSDSWQDVPGDTWDYELFDLGPNANIFYHPMRSQCWHLTEMGLYLSDTVGRRYLERVQNSDLPAASTISNESSTNNNEQPLNNGNECNCMWDGLRNELIEKAAMTRQPPNAAVESRIAERKPIIEPKVSEQHQQVSKTGAVKRNRSPKTGISRKPGEIKLRRSSRIRQKQEEIPKEQRIPVKRRKRRP